MNLCKKLNLKIWAVIIVTLLFCPNFLSAAETVIESAEAKLIMDFNQGLNISDGDTLKVIYTGSQADPRALLRDTSGNSSYWGGTFWSNYNVVFVNTNGIIFGANANIQAASLIASTLNISNNDFLNGKYNFFKDGKNAFIINRGNIKFRNGGYAILLSQAVQNLGNISLEAGIGSVALAAGEAMTLNLDDAGDISVVIDEAVKSIVLGENGERITSAVKNDGTIITNGGKVILTAKVLNGVFDYAVNNTGIIEAKNIVNHNGVIEITAQGAPVINSGSLIAGKVRVEIKDAGFTNTGKINAEKIYITSKDIWLGGPIGGPTTKIIEIVTGEITTINSHTLAPDPDPVNNNPTAIIQANQVRISAKKFGTATAPIRIIANLMQINRIGGNIDILNSTGIGTSILLRGPPDGFGSIIYNLDTNLTLNASSGAIYIGINVRLAANNLTLKSQNGIYSIGSLITLNTLTLISDGDIYSLGLLKSSNLIERGNTFKIGGIFYPGYTDIENADGAMEFIANTNVSGPYSDYNIIIDPNVILTLTGNTSFTAGNSFLMDPTATINGQGYDLSILAVSDSTLGNINNVHLLIVKSTNGTLIIASIVSTNGGNITFTAGQDIIQESAITTNGGNYTATAGGAYILTGNPSITSGSGIVTIIASTVKESFPGSGAVTSYDWSYLGGNRSYSLIEFGYYFLLGSTIVHVPSISVGVNGNINSPISGTQNTNIKNLRLYIVMNTGAAIYYWYSDSARNVDGGVHAKISAPTVYNWEDQNLSNSDADYNDVILQTQILPTLTITANLISKIYGQIVNFTGYEFTTSGLLSGDNVTSVTLTSLGAPAAANVAGSPYGITPSAAVGTGLSNYDIVYVDGTLTVVPKIITVTADPQSKTQGAPDPAFTYTNTPLIGSDTFTGALSRAAGEDVGDYAIDQGTLTAGDNYSLNYIGANMAISAPSATDLPVLNLQEQLRYKFPMLEQMLPGNLVIYRPTPFDMVSSSDLTGPVYFYQPLTSTDITAFDSQYNVEDGAYDFINGSINMNGHDGLLPMLEGIKKNKKIQA